MTERIRRYVGLFFDELPYSDEAAEARVKIEQALEATASDAAPDELKKKIAPNVPNHHRDLMLHILLNPIDEKTARTVMKNFVGSSAAAEAPPAGAARRKQGSR